MATREEILNKAKYVFIDEGLRIDEKHTPEYTPEIMAANRKGIQEFLKDKEYLKLGTNNPDDCYKAINSHHYTTKYWYSHFDDIFRYMNIPYKREDFELIPNIVNDEDYSYLSPIYSPMFRFTETSFEVKDNVVWYLPNSKVKTCRFEGFTNTTAMGGTPYHCLFKGAHEPCMLENLSIKEGKTYLISGNSHTIPLAPILGCYVKKLIYLDSRYGINFSFLYKDEDINNIEPFIFISYANNIDKFISSNIM